jgi:DNA-binding transcriptional ArsR family regulator
MVAGRKRIDLEMQGTKGSRQRMWEAIRLNASGFKICGLARRADVSDITMRRYLKALLKGNYLEVVSGTKLDEQVLRLIKDVGAEAPAVNSDGKLSVVGQGTEAMWRTLRILGELNAAELAEQASTVVKTSPETAKSYLKWLARAGYLVVTDRGGPGRHARYRLAQGKNTGPRPPMIQNIGQVFDPNLGEVVFRQPVKDYDL